VLAALVCGTCLGFVPASAQTVDVQSSTAGSTAKTEKGVTTDGNNTTAGAETRAPASAQMRADNEPAAKGKARIVPKATASGAGNMPQTNGDESGIAPRADTANATGPDAQAIRSADSTAHKTVYDPNDQLGTSLEGRTKPTADTPDQTAQAQQN
jgi:hypothetical protein